jgi:hypothetical protein
MAFGGGEMRRLRAQLVLELLIRKHRSVQLVRRRQPVGRSEAVGHGRISVIGSRNEHMFDGTPSL